MAGEHQTVGRFAPSPSGPLHLGNLACALVAYLSARAQGGRFLLRVEDLDIPRCPPVWAWQAMRDLEAIGIEWDEEPLWQSRRTEYYEAAFRKLDRMGVLYPCFCTRAELVNPSLAPNAGDTQRVYPGTCAGLSPEQRRVRSLTRHPAWRVRVPDREYMLRDRVQGVYRENLKTQCGDFVIRRSDGLFGYQLAVVVDDAYSGVNEVVRGRDILSATPRQMYLMELLNVPVPAYAHIPLICDAHGKRLAKRDQALGFAVLQQRYGASGVRGMLAYALGLIPENRPVSMPELLAAFDWERVSREDARLPDTGKETLQ